MYVCRQPFPITNSVTSTMLGKRFGWEKPVGHGVERKGCPGLKHALSRGDRGIFPLKVENGIIRDVRRERGGS